MICKYFVLFSQLPFPFVDCVFAVHTHFSLMWFDLPFFFYCLCFWCQPINLFPDQCQGASSLDGMFCVYVLGSSGLKLISRPMFIYSFSVWITYPLLKRGIEVLYCYCIAVHFSLQLY